MSGAEANNLRGVLSRLNTPGYPQETHPALRQLNLELTDMPVLVSWLIGEILEWKENVEAGEINHEWWLELFDVLVFLELILTKLGDSQRARVFDQVQATHINGQFTDFDQLVEMAQGIESGADPAASVAGLTMSVLSLLNHLQLELQVDFYHRLLQEKLFANRHARFFQIESGMSVQEILLKTEHVLRALRLIRDLLEKRCGKKVALRPWITDFFEPEIMDWRNSALALEQIEKKMLLFAQHLAQKIDLTSVPIRIDGGDQDLYLQLELVGARVLRVQ